MQITPNSIAAVVGSSVENTQFQIGAQVLQRIILIIASYDPAKTLVVDDVPIQVLSKEDVGAKTGFGFMLYRLADKAFKGSNGSVPVFILPQSEVAGNQAEGDITFAASGLIAGTISMYIAGDSVAFTVADADTADDVAAKAAAAITADSNLPVTASATLAVVTITAKTTGTYGNEISIRFNIKAGEVDPVGLTSAVVTDMTGGTGTPDITTALNGLGTGDDSNSAHFTDVVHGYLQDTTTLDAISAYVGAGDTIAGLYSDTVARPFRVLTGDVDPGSAALTALIALGDGRTLDRGNGVIARPGSANHPSEIASQAIGMIAATNNNLAEQGYAGQVMVDIDPGEKADDWASEYTNRDTAVKSGVSPTKIAGGAVLLQNVVTFYRPETVPVESNGYRSMRNISIIQNMLDSVKVLFSSPKWQGFTIVADVSKVTNPSNAKARDVDAVRDDLVALIKDWESKAWVFEADFTIDKLGEAGAIVIRDGGNGFDSKLPVKLSGEGGILNNLTQFDVSIAAL